MKRNTTRQNARINKRWRKSRRLKKKILGLQSKPKTPPSMQLERG